MPRTEVTKKLWAYIKRNGLQDAKNRRMINADDKLRPVFGGKSQVSMFDMTKLVNKPPELAFAPARQRGRPRWGALCVSPGFSGRDRAITFPALWPANTSSRCRTSERSCPPSREILKGIYLSFFPGAKIGVLGANGAGKIIPAPDHGRRGQGLPGRGAAR